jgi:ribosomal protein S12 methylthiotransferase accessory factor
LNAPAPALHGEPTAVAAARRALGRRPELAVRLAGAGLPVVMRSFPATADDASAAAADEIGIVAARSALLVVRLRPEGPCPACLDSALARGAPADSSTDASPFGPSASPSALPLALELAAQAAAADDGAPGQPVWRVDGTSLRISREALLPAEGCPGCRPLQPRPAPEPSALRTAFGAAASPTRRRSVETLQAPLREACIGPWLGLVQECGFDLQMPVAAASAWSPVSEKRREPTLGRAERYDHALTVALAEALERNAGLFGGASHAARRAPFAALGEEAVDPRTLGLHPDPLYDRPGFPFRRFDPESPIEWAAALDVTNGRRVWIPRCFAYYAPTEEPALAFETSNGCAIGSSLAEAAYHGLLELVERDAFLYHWYAGTSPPRIDDVLASSPEIAARAARIRLYTGAQLQVVDTTRDHCIPSVAVVGLSDDPRGPATALAAGAGLSLPAAAGAALLELGGHMMRLAALFEDEAEIASLRGLLDQAEAVRTMEQHGALNALPEARSRFAPLLSGPRRESWSREACVAGNSPEALLAALVERLRLSGERVILVDQTTRALARLDLHAVKVLVPGWLPMTFGHVFRRTALPSLAGVADSALLPHPFP